MRQEMTSRCNAHSGIWKRTQAVLFGFFALFVFAFSLEVNADEATVTDVRLGENAGKTRFVLDLDREVTYSYFLLADPYRIVVDLEEVAWGLPGPGQGEGKGLIRDYRFGLFQPGQSRIVLDLKDPADVENIFFLPPQGGYPYRLVMDLAPVRRDDFLEAITKKGGPTATYVPTVPPEKIIPKPSQRTIVIDPGHGGVDPGTISTKGNQEKDIVLETAKQIKKTLESTGNFRVLLTRDTDIYVPHRQRFEYARAAGADLFISIHADSISDQKIRGATVYTLSEKASDREAAALASKENKSDLIAGINLNGESSEAIVLPDSWC